jgi:hypothetical protein
MESSSSESSDSELEFSPREISKTPKNEIVYPVNTVKKSGPVSDGPSLQEVSDMIREYEKQEKKERKAHKHKLDTKESVTVTQEDLARLTLTKKQMKQLRPKKERSEAQIESARRLAEANKQKALLRKQQKEAEEKTLDVRLDKTKPGFQVKVAPGKKYVRKPKAPEPEPEEEEEDDEPEVFKPSRGFQGRKPKVEPEEDEVEKKVEKLNKLNNVLASSNPFLAQVLASRGIRY